MVQLECDSVLEHFCRKTKGTFPFKKSSSPISIAHGKIQLEQVAFLAGCILIFASSPSETNVPTEMYHSYHS